MLKIENLKVSYGGIEAVKGISFSGGAGADCHADWGQRCREVDHAAHRCGAGQGRVGLHCLRGGGADRAATDQIVRRGITLVPEGRRVFPDLTVLENLKIGAYTRKDDLSEDIEWVYSLFPRLKERHWQPAGTLSGGEQQMLAVGRALMSRPKLLMMDEPSLGLAPLIVQDIFSIIREINRQGVTILLIEQNANMALRIAEVGHVLETGAHHAVGLRGRAALQRRREGSLPWKPK